VVTPPPDGGSGGASAFATAATATAPLTALRRYASLLYRGGYMMCDWSALT